MREGHYLRHLRRAKRVYSTHLDALLECLSADEIENTVAGLAVLLPLPDEVSDIAITREAFALGISPSPLSLWYGSSAFTRSGLLLGLATAPEKQIMRAYEQLKTMIQRLSGDGSSDSVGARIRR